MLDDRTKRRLSQKLQNTHLKRLVTGELASLLAVKPDDISAEEYCHGVAEEIVHELKNTLCRASANAPTLPSRNVLEEANNTPNLNGAVKKLSAGVENALLSGNLQMLRALGEAIAQRDTGNSSHNPRVTLYSTLTAEVMELESVQIRALIKGSFLHDIGKIGISDDIILKPGGLTDDERRTMNAHPEIGAAIVRGVHWLEDAREVIRYHHEWHDGTGYPHKLKGGAIPLSARVFAIVDVFDALTSKRPYKPAYSYEKTMQIIFDRRGTHFDPWIVESFANISRRLYDEIAWEPYHILDAQLSRKVADHFGMDSP